MAYSIFCLIKKVCFLVSSFMDARRGTTTKVPKSGVRNRVVVVVLLLAKAFLLLLLKAFVF